MSERQLSTAWFLKLACLLALVGATVSVVAEDDATKAPAVPSGLKALQPLVGEWRGAGQLKRGSTEGGWTEDSAWVWRFPANKKGGEAAADATLEFTSARGKYFQSGRIRPAGEKGRVELIAKGAEGREVVYSGQTADDGSLVLTAADAPADMPLRVSIRVVAGGDRLVVLLERKSAISDRYARIAEVGYTRKGSEFGKGSSQPECVVTGGLGTMQVTFEGQMYYVCCAGCRDLFEQKPAEILAEYRERKEAEKKKKKDR